MTRTRSTSATTTISAVLIVKDEAAVLDASLAALHWVDEIIVYDTGSSDSTREIAAKYTEHVIDGSWDDDFGAARNRALEHATSDWVLSIDADEIFQGDPGRLRAALDPDVGRYMVLAENLSDLGADRTIFGVVRVFLRAGYRWSGKLHEKLVGRSSELELAVVRPIPDVSLLHSGYLAESVAGKDKAARNLKIARTELESAVSEQRPSETIAFLRANVARTLGMAGQMSEGLALGRETLDSGSLTREGIVTLVTAMVEYAVILEDDAAVDAMLDLWIEHADNPAWALGRKAVVLAGREDVHGTLDILDRIPTTVVDSRQMRFIKHELAAVEVWALMRAERFKDAVRVAVRAAGAGYPSLEPSLLTEIFDRARTPLADLVRAIPDTLWTTLAMQATNNPIRSSRIFLEEMNRHRPGDPTVLTCVSVLAGVLSLEEAAAWAVELRTYGMVEDCPLVAIALDGSADPRQRAVAGAMVLDVYGDERAVPGLEAALALVPAEQEAELVSYLDVVAPGLVSHASAS